MAKSTQGGKGFRADRVTGDMVQGQTVSVVTGRIVNGDVVTTCSTCEGQRGWSTADGVVVHLACGTVQ
jgi:hypothetical protein